MMFQPKGLNAPIIRCRHAHLKPAEGQDPTYRRECPACGVGMLLVTRRTAWTLSRLDRCTLCGQQVWYTDHEINGIKFAQP